MSKLNAWGHPKQDPEQRKEQQQAKQQQDLAKGKQQMMLVRNRLMWNCCLVTVAGE